MSLPKGFPRTPESDDRPLAARSDGSVTVGHLTFTTKGDRTDSHCSICGQGVEVGPMFGPIPGDVLLAEWAKQHAHKPRKARR